MKRIIIVAAMLVLGLTAFAADLTIDMQVNAVATDYANNYLTFKGPAVTVTKDQFDATTSASKLESTALLNIYRTDIYGKKLMPGALRSLLLYSVADEATRLGDNLQVAKASTGVITIRYTHRGTANEIVTDKNGKISLPGLVVKARKIGHSDNTIHSDFSKDGKASGVDWAKVWDASIAADKVVGTTTSKTGKITDDVANSDILALTGDLQVTFDGKVLKILGTVQITDKK
jgi:hypothetical protein